MADIGTARQCRLEKEVGGQALRRGWFAVLLLALEASLRLI